MASTQLERPLREARTGHGWYAFAARFGLVAKGVSYGIVGGLALELALGLGGEATSNTGALETLAHRSYGTVLLVLLALGFAAYACWRIVQGFAQRDESTAKTWAKRIGYVARGLVYAALTASAVKILLGSDTASQNGKAKHTTATFLSLPAGTVLVGVAGGIFLAVALWQVYRGVSRSFEERWRTLSHTARLWGGRVGFAGHLARGVVFGLVGIFVIKAAVDYNPRDAIGLDGALQKLAHTSYGPWLLGLTAAGLVCYGLFCFVDARYRDVSANA
jgi:uncharacterized membrane protein YidH (DUF202 family)